MHTYEIYYENADTDDSAVYIGTIEAISMADALQLAAEYYEIPSHDLVAKLVK